ncbi:neurotensin receptor type 1 [Xenopus laevis]|uniref:Neurotensin receptor type 1 n=1 Tax=Xenopus laevis TaxID=8355 RepID=A0A8J1LT60_XENLA|nr:neurotensin receptor type 1 [Xenopus laevis]
MRFNATSRLPHAAGHLYRDVQDLLLSTASASNLSLSNLSDLMPKPIMSEDELDVNTDIYSKILVTVVYLFLFIVGCTGNSITAYTLVKKKSLQNLQSTVHYHLASLALSDLLILILSMPIELYNFIWVHHPWAFGNTVCKGYYFLRDACTYATALNIASLSVERYLAMCHPFKAKSIMSRSRTKKLISFIWLASLLLASPMIFTMGQIYGLDTEHPNNIICTRIVEMSTFKTVIQVNAFLSFVFPMVVISVLNTIIANQLIIMVKQAHQENQVCTIGGQQTVLSMSIEPSRIQSLKHGVRVLRVVVIAFVVCWLPYHVRRLMFCYIPEEMWTDELNDFYHYFYMMTNVLFYVSSTVNPILYNLVSANFRQIFVSTLSFLCPPWRRKKKRPTFTRKSNSISSTNHTFSTQITRETLY